MDEDLVGIVHGPKSAKILHAIGSHDFVSRRCQRVALEEIICLAVVIGTMRARIQEVTGF
jgi:hypothetical protein